MAIRLTLILTLVLFVTTAVASIARAPAKMVAHYKVSSMGVPVGEVFTTQHLEDENGISSAHFETITSVKASFLWMGYQLSSTEKGTLRNGTLVSYSRKGLENGAIINVDGWLDDKVFHFDVKEHGLARTVVIPRSSYDYTTMECPEARLDFSGNTPVILRILDVEKLVVVKREYRLVSNEQYKIADKEYPCRIIDFADRNKKARRWISWDGTAVFMYRQDSRGEKHTYSVQATSMTKEM